MRLRLFHCLTYNRCKVFLSFVTIYHVIFYLLYQEVDSRFINNSDVTAAVVISQVFSSNEFRLLNYFEPH